MKIYKNKTNRTLAFIFWVLSIGSFISGFSLFYFVGADVAQYFPVALEFISQYNITSEMINMAIIAGWAIVSFMFFLVYVNINSGLRKFKELKRQQKENRQFKVAINNFLDTNPSREEIARKMRMLYRQVARNNN